MEHEGATEEEALIAATNCDNIEAAKNYLQQECELCMNIMKIVEVKTKEHKKVEAAKGWVQKMFLQSLACKLYYVMQKICILLKLSR